MSIVFTNILESFEHIENKKQQTNTLLEIIKTKINSVIEDISNFKLSYDEYTRTYIKNRSYIYISNFDMRFINIDSIQTVFSILKENDNEIEQFGDNYKISFTDKSIQNI